MPVNLDDLQLLQDNMTETFKAIMKLLSGGQDVFFIKRPEITDESTNARPYVRRVGSGILYVKGELVSWEEQVFEGEPPAHETFWAVIRHGEEDSREFADGQKHTCRSITFATLTDNNEGVSEAYDLSTVPLLHDIIAGWVYERGWKVLAGTFFNGYSGVLQIRSRDNAIELSLDLYSYEDKWKDHRYTLVENSFIVFSANRPFSMKGSGEMVVNDAGGNRIGTVTAAPSGSIFFTPEDSQKKPSDCPIKITIRI